MGFVLTILYIVLTIISPGQFGPSWVNYHVLVYLGVVTFLVSLPNMLNHMQLSASIETQLLLAFIIAIGLSEIANGWFGGVIDSWVRFMPSAAVFFFIVANVSTARRLKIVTLAVVASCLLVAVEAFCGYYGGFRSETFVLQVPLYEQDQIVGQLLRIRGAGFLSDPNDLAQILAIALPLTFIGWRQGRVIANLLIVLLPAALLSWAIFLTHSRGALVGLAVVALMAGRKWLGTTTSAVLTGALVLALLALNFTGGREISPAEGVDRLAAWSEGLQFFRSAPLFGIGFGAFADFNDITAHNSFVLCLAELCLIGSIIWVALLVTPMMSLNRIISSVEKPATQGGHQKDFPRIADETGKVEPGLAPYSDNQPFLTDARTSDFSWWEGRPRDNTRLALMEDPNSPLDFESDEQTIPMEIAPLLSDPCGGTKDAVSVNVETLIGTADQNAVPRHWVIAMRLSLVSFMTTGWFLSRSYATTLYLILGLATATIAIQEGFTDSRNRAGLVWITLAVEALAIVFLYGSVRLGH